MARTAEIGASNTAQEFRTTSIEPHSDSLAGRNDILPAPEDSAESAFQRGFAKGWFAALEAHHCLPGKEDWDNIKIGGTD
jgi:hypothetical protein